MHWACPLCRHWLGHPCPAGLLVTITDHLVGAHVVRMPTRGDHDRSAARVHDHDACTASTCADPRPVRR